MRKDKFRFLIPFNFHRLEFAKTQKNAAENVIESEKNAGEGLAIPSTVEHLIGLVFGTKSFKPQGENKQKKRKRY